jgi:hypothetical protein
MSLLSVIIPSGGPDERFFRKTIEDVLLKAAGEVEVYAMTDGWVAPREDRVQDDRVIYVDLDPSEHNQKRQAVNLAVSLCDGEYVMALDAHCMMAPGFDSLLIEACPPNGLIVPRRLRLDAENWCLEDSGGRPPIDYEYFMWRSILNKRHLAGYKWDARTLERLDLHCDRICTCQGSTWLLRKQLFQDLGLMSTEGYGGWGAEAEEMVFEVYRAGGEARVLKDECWYAHLHKGRTYGRMYNLNNVERKSSYAYSYQLWIYDRRDFFVPFMKEFQPMPGWPSNWQDQIYGGTESCPTP